MGRRRPRKIVIQLQELNKDLEEACSGVFVDHKGSTQKIQIRDESSPNTMEVSGNQADKGKRTMGALGLRLTAGRSSPHQENQTPVETTKEEKDPPIEVMEGFVGSGRHFTKAKLETIVPTSDGTRQMNGWQEVIDRKTERSNQRQDVQRVLEINVFNYMLNMEEIDNGSMEVKDDPD
ncbi:hypothetical protein HAX54_028434 [Datura stramonium]|uniref:Uncharacterized protein n=1 Tax=Datura stramonium TaxID=4076 RepID=A0ABS8Y767_DATST|nr:hypothetical protein [Datura stramonium]